MTIIDALNANDNGHVRVVCGDRWLIAHVDGEGQCFTVYEKRARMKNARCLVETESQDEACRFLTGEK